MAELKIKKLVKKNQWLVDIVKGAPTKGSYKALDAEITTQEQSELIVGFKKGEGYISRNDLIWAIINEITPKKATRVQA